jgi:hypothetical protein
MKINLPQFGHGERPVVPQNHDPEKTPQVVTVSFDRLRLLTHQYMSGIEDSQRWLTYLGIALSVFAAVATGDFSFKTAKLGLDGSQWQILFVVAGIYSTVRGLIALKRRLKRPTIDSFLSDVLANSQYSREERAIFLMKHRDKRGSYRVLVFRDPLWECYMLPHYNIANTNPSPVDDSDLLAHVSGFLGCSQSDLTVSYIEGCDLRSRKLSEFYRQDTLYRFAFYLVQLRGAAELPAHMRPEHYEYSGRSYAWMTAPEMEADDNTRRRNMDMTRHLLDNEGRMLVQTPSCIPNDPKVDW